jgi:hypothetical protein
MRHGITRLVLGCRQFADLTPEQYTEAKTAKERLLAALSIEEKLNLVLENYAEFEQELQALTMCQLLFHDRDWSSFTGEAQTINRRLANLLSACRLYIDQTRHDVSAVYGDDSDQLKQLNEAFSAEYDAYLGCRVLEALRNHVQHRSLPVHNLKYSLARDERPHRTLVKHTCIPCLSVKRIKDQGDFKAQVLEELEAGDDLVDLKPLVREYVASIGRVHEDLRQLMRDHVAKWEEVVYSIQSQFREAFGENVVGLAVVARDDDGVVRESAQIFEDLITRRRRLEQKNRNVADIRSHYVSSEVLGDEL